MATVFVVPSNGGNIIQTAPGFPSVPLQAPGAIPYPQYGAQQLGIPTNAPQQAPQKGPLEKFLNAEPKVLGAIQIMIGLLHIGFGAVSLCLLPPYYLNVYGIGGYPFWGGIFFISTGSVCVSAAKNPNPGLVKSSVGLNITSAIMALTGIILNLIDLNLSRNYYGRNDQSESLSLISIGFGFSSLLLLFSLLEFCIAVSLAHFGCLATCLDDQPTLVFVPYQVIGDGEVASQPNFPTPPPTCDNMVTKSY
ncbi:membrane-spanning 4-domains subfamily A member 15-like [Erythrolamprus reginae]|uniref:membrane-spanning 4-domains subfamily A member 15-like n=1 Tax=Erythrolamprus reginae TaxID=121349 RepID=UPI00396CB0D0